MNISQAIHEFKHKLIRGALELNDGNISKTARMLGCSRNSLIRWSKTLDLLDYAAELRSQAQEIRIHRVYRFAGQLAVALCFCTMVLYAAPALA